MSKNDDRESVASHCYAVGRPDDGSFTIHVNGELRGKYANAETLQTVCYRVAGHWKSISTIPTLFRSYPIDSWLHNR